MDDLLGQLIDDLAVDFRQARARAIQIGLESPEAVPALLHGLLHRQPDGSALFNDLVGYLPTDAFPALVEAALTLLRANRQHQAAQDVITWASLQALPALHPHLDELYTLAPNERSYNAPFPWRESGFRHVDTLGRIVADRSLTVEARRRARLRLLETRQAAALSLTVAWAEDLTQSSAPGLYGVGFEQEGPAFRQLYAPEPMHLGFPLDYRAALMRPPWSRKVNHPTWRLAEESPAIRFGGHHPATCAVCGQGLAHLLSLDPVPASLPMIALPALTLATCLSCLGWPRRVLFYHHSADGQPESTGYSGPRVVPEAAAESFREVVVTLTPAPARWRWQDWGLSSGRENLHRLGGHPTWIQGAEYPACSQCQRRMQFILQLYSGLWTDSGMEWGWGSRGICYGFWCATCHISAFVWQST